MHAGLSVWEPRQARGTSLKNSTPKLNGALMEFTAGTQLWQVLFPALQAELTPHRHWLIKINHRLARNH